jgi:hypothetical protein
MSRVDAVAMKRRPPVGAAYFSAVETGSLSMCHHPGSGQRAAGRGILGRGDRENPEVIAYPATIATQSGVLFVKNRSTSIAFALVLGLALPILAADKAQPVRMGCGLMTFDTVPGWGLGPDGKSVIGPCHGSVVVDRDGNIYTGAHAGVFVFSP